jgi:glycosyltransferase involved in cell wall biosynthesis
MEDVRRLSVAIECRIDDPRTGVGSAVLSLAHALSESGIPDQEYTFIVHADTRAWLEPHIFGHCRLVCIDRPTLSGVKNVLGRVAPMRAIWRKLRASVFTLPRSDGFVEAGHFDLVHFPTTAAYLTSLPSIYQPWDLQHLHFPQFFSSADRELRERQYRAFCNHAEYVCVQTEWSKRDVIQQYGLAPEKIAVILWGSVFDAYTVPSEEVRKATAKKYQLPAQFFFYPAVTWMHKNHEVILRALHLIKTEHHRSVEVYFTGASTGYRADLDRLASKLGISDQVHYLGFLAPEELQCIFRTATAMVFASRFEGFGLPVLEAFHAGLPVLSSNATVLPEIAQDGALYFDPDDARELAGLMIRMLDDPEARRLLIEKGAARLSHFSINETAAQFQRLYAQVAIRRSVHAGNPMGAAAETS